MDPLSSVLSLVKIHSYWSGGFEWGGDWCLHFPRDKGIKIYAVVSGQCWVSVEGVSEPVLARPGDCMVLPTGRPFRVGSDLSLPSVNALTRESNLDLGGITINNGGGDFFGIGANFDLTGENANLLTELLPPVLHIRSESDKAVLHWALDRLAQELRDPQPGGFLVGQQLSTMLLVQALRLYLRDVGSGGVGWLFALGDKQISIAISAIHKAPAHRWSIQTLAELAGMSRTIFAVKFKETVGKAPMEYVTHWRMLLAKDRLSSSNDSISAIAESLGYESDSAFSTAFKRVVGCSPRQHSRKQGLASPSPLSL